MEPAAIFETLILVLLLVAGLLCHFLKKVIEIRRGGEKISLLHYWIHNPHHAALSLIAAAAAFLLLYGTPEMTRSVAFAIGYAADSVAGMIGRRRLDDSLGR